MYAGKVFFQMSCLGSPDPRPMPSDNFSVANPDLGSGNRCLFEPWNRDPEWVKKSWSGYGIRIRYEQPGSYFRKLKKIFFGLKYLNPLIRIRDPGLEIVVSGIRDKHSWSPTLIKVLKFLVYWPKFSGFLLLFDPGSGIQDSGWISNIGSVHEKVGFYPPVLWRRNYFFFGSGSAESKIAAFKLPWKLPFWMINITFL